MSNTEQSDKKIWALWEREWRIFMQKGAIDGN